jgi:hypothetical protein
MTTQTATRLRCTLALSAATACVLVACGGDQVAGIQGSGNPVAAGTTAVGPISAFGSIILDGVEYSTSGAQIRIDGEVGSESQLRVGHVVTLKGTVNPDGTTGTATEVSFTGNVRAAVTQVDLAANQFTMLGQTVRVDDSTSFDELIDPADLSGLPVGSTVQVSGFSNADGAILATRVDLASATSSIQIKGTVQALDATARTFRINSLTVSYSGIAPSGTLANGSIVSAQGSTLSLSGALVATRVDVSAGVGAPPNQRGQLEGLITDFTSNSAFVVEGQPVVTTASTEFELRGGTLGLNVPIKVRGTFDASGTLVATRVEVKQQSSAEILGVLDTVSAASGTLTVLGVPVTTNSFTSFEDKSQLKVRQFKLSDLRSGDYVDVRGVQSATGGGLTATSVERRRPDTEASVQGVAQNLAAPGFSVLGVSVLTDAQTQFPGLGNPAGAAARFFSEAANQIVNVRGTFTGGVLVADRVQIRNANGMDGEDDDD